MAFSWKGSGGWHRNQLASAPARENYAASEMLYIRSAGGPPSHSHPRILGRCPRPGGDVKFGQTWYGHRYGDDCRSAITRLSSTYSVAIGKRGDELALGACGNFRSSDFLSPR